MSLKREQAYRRALGIADGASALATSLIIAAVWGEPIQWLFLLVPFAAIVISKIQGLYDRDDMVIRKSTLQEWRALLRANALTAIALYVVWWSLTDDPSKHGIRVFALMVGTLFAVSLPARALARKIASNLTTDERCLIVGAPGQCARLERHLADVPGLELIGIVSDDDVDCSVAGVHELVERLDVERIVVVPHSGWGEPGSLKLIQSSKWLGVRVSLMPTVMTVDWRRDDRG